MAGKITRTVSFTRIICTQVIVEDGVPKLVPGKDLILFARGITRDKATVIVRREYGQDYSVVKIIEETAKYEMPLEDFVLYGRKVADVPPEMVPSDEEDTDSDEETAPEDNATFPDDEPPLPEPPPGQDENFSPGYDQFADPGSDVGYYGDDPYMEPPEDGRQPWDDEPPSEAGVDEGSEHEL